MDLVSLVLYLLLYMILNLGVVDFPIYFGTVVDISGIVGKHGVGCVRVALMGFDDCFIRERFTHSVFLP